MALYHRGHLHGVGNETSRRTLVEDLLSDSLSCRSDIVQVAVSRARSVCVSCGVDRVWYATCGSPDCSAQVTWAAVRGKPGAMRSTSKIPSWLPRSARIRSPSPPQREPEPAPTRASFVSGATKKKDGKSQPGEPKGKSRILWNDVAPTRNIKKPKERKVS